MKKFNKYALLLCSLILTFSFILSGCNNVQVDVSSSDNSGNSNKTSSTYNLSKNNKENPKKDSKNNVKEVFKNDLFVHYINVGQGDSELIQYKGKNVLIDAGPNSARNSLLKYLKGAGIKKLDYVVATHPHEDHIGNMDDVIRNFQIGEFIAPKVSSTTATFKSMITALKSKNLRITTAKSGLKISLDKNVNFEFFSPNSASYENLNNYSPVMKLSYGKNSFLFTGDAETLSEKEILSKNFNVKSDVLKFGHHGSSTSSSIAFLRKVNPKIGIISCSKDNKYGHPHKETVKKIKDMNIKTYSTYIDDTIILTSNGTTIKKLNK